MRGLRELVFSVTTRCTAKCTDCPIVFENLPSASLTSEEMIEIIEEMLPWKTLRLVVFTGGEPFLVRDDIKEVVAFASENKLLTRIVTNAYWATSRSAAYKILEQMKEAGLTEINISCDDYHQEYIPVENIKNANKAAFELGIPALIAHRECPDGNISIEYLSEYLGIKLQKFKKGGKNPRNYVYSSGPNIPIKSKRKCTSRSRSWMDPCPSVLNKIVISADKRVRICCGIVSDSIEELTIGTIRKRGDLIQILRAGNEDLITNWLALAGPASILEFVRSQSPGLGLPDNYVNRCHVCNELFTSEEVRRVLFQSAAQMLEMVECLRSILDWVTDDWMPDMYKQKMNIST